MASELIEALEILEKEKDISRESIIGAIENALVTAYKNQYKKKDSILAAENVFAKVNEETGELISTINSAGSLAIKFDNIKTSPNELYEKIDELKNIKTEFGYCKGYKPQFRPQNQIPVKMYSSQLKRFIYCQKPMTIYWNKKN